MSKIDLMPFCRRKPSRYDIRVPFIQGGYLCATDGCILVRIPTAKPETVVAVPELRLPNVHNGMPWKQPGAWRPWPQRKRIGRSRVCPKCRGPVYDGVFQWINGRHIGARYDELIRKLPKRQYRHLPDPDEEEPLLFRFAGGEGLLMPALPGSRWPQLKGDGA